MGKRVDNCPCCGSIDSCGCHYGLPSSYRLTIHGVSARTDKLFNFIERASVSCVRGSAGSRNYQTGEDIVAACDSLNGTYLLNRATQTVCKGIMYPNALQNPTFIREGELEFYYWLSDTFIIDGQDTINLTLFDQTCCSDNNLDLMTPTEYIFILIRAISGNGLPTYTGQGPFYTTVVPCTLNLYLLPVEAILRKLANYQYLGNLCNPLKISENLCNLLYDPKRLGASSDSNDGVYSFFCFEDIILNSCYSGCWIFLKSNPCEIIRLGSHGSNPPVFKCLFDETNINLTET